MPEGLYNENKEAIIQVWCHDKDSVEKCRHLVGFMPNIVKELKESQG